MKNSVLALLAVGGIILLSISGCASKGYIEEQVEMLSVQNQGLESEISSLRSETRHKVEEIQTKVKTFETDLAENERDISIIRDATQRNADDLQRSLNLAQEALDRATAGQQVKGKLLYEVTMSDASIPFGYDQTRLSEDAKAGLDTFANVLLGENRGVFIEIQGHTDSIGSDKYNLDLGEARAESVKRYLYLQHGIPLNRMSTFSYGESQPVTDNKTKEGRAQNRRVVLLVME